MHRGYIVLILLILSSLACGLVHYSYAGIPRNQPPNESHFHACSPRILHLQKPDDTQIPAAENSSSPTQEEQPKTPYPTSVLDAQLTSQINQIQSQVIEERGLQPENPVPVILLSPGELRQNVINDFLADYTDEEMADDVLELFHHRAA